MNIDCMIAFSKWKYLNKRQSVICLTDRKLPPVAVFTPSTVPRQGVSNIAHFIHKVVNSATFKPPWTGVKRKLTFYDLKCEFYRYCAPSNGNYRHKQLKRRGETRKSRPQSSFPALAAVIRPHHLLFLWLHSSHTPLIILMDQKYLCRSKDI